MIPPAVIVERKKLTLRKAEPFTLQKPSEPTKPEVDNAQSKSPSPEKEIQTEKNNTGARPRLRANNTEFSMQENNTTSNNNNPPDIMNIFHQMQNNPEMFEKLDPQTKQQFGMLMQMQMQQQQMMNQFPGQGGMNQFPGMGGQMGGMDQFMGMGGGMNQFMGMMDDDDEDDDDLDEDMFVVECKDCECCNGFPYICKNSDFCREMDQCFCIMKMDTEATIQEENAAFRDDLKNCECCHGYYLKCKGDICQDLGACHCVVHEDM